MRRYVQPKQIDDATGLLVVDPPTRHHGAATLSESTIDSFVRFVDRADRGSRSMPQDTVHDTMEDMAS